MTAASEPVALRPGPSDAGELREMTRLEKAVGPEWARLLRGIATNPLSVIGIVLIVLFALMAIFAPFLAPPPNENWNPMQIPRAGFRAEPEPPMTVWTKNAPMTVPWWYRNIWPRQEEWVHLMGTTSGQYDIWYGFVWGARTAFFLSLIHI